MINEEWRLGSSPRFFGSGVDFSQSKQHRKGSQWPMRKRGEERAARENLRGTMGTRV